MAANYSLKGINTSYANKIEELSWGAARDLCNLVFSYEITITGRNHFG